MKLVLSALATLRKLMRSKIKDFMSLSSINIQPVKSTSESHNKRSVDLGYVRKELSKHNDSWSNDTIHNRTNFVKHRCKELSGRKMQKNAIPIREGVLLFEEHHTLKDMHRVKDALHDQFGLQTFQIYMHRDEGHNDLTTGEWKPNYHAHFLFDWTDGRTGKMMRLNKMDMRKMQTIVATTLNMQRGKESGVTRLSAIDYKVAKRKEELKALEEILNPSNDLIKTNILGQVDKEETRKNIDNLLKLKNLNEYKLRELQKDYSTLKSKLVVLRDKDIKIYKLKKELEEKKILSESFEEALYLATPKNLDKFREKNKDRGEIVLDRYKKKKQRKAEIEERKRQNKNKDRGKGGMSR